jgi:hypothetical protein
MAEFGRVCGGHADLIRAILVSISHLNKLPVSLDVLYVIGIELRHLEQFR